MITIFDIPPWFAINLLAILAPILGTIIGIYIGNSREHHQSS